MDQSRVSDVMKSLVTLPAECKHRPVSHRRGRAQCTYVTVDYTAVDYTAVDYTAVDYTAVD